MTGNLVMGGNTVKELGDPQDDADAVGKKFMETYVSEKHKSFSASIQASGWSETAPYIQTVAVDGILIGDFPHIIPVYTGDAAEKTAQKEAWNMVCEGDAGDGNITFTCLTDRPEVDILIQIEVNR